MILFNRISSDVVLVLPQLPLIRNGNYHLWWGAHIYLSIQTDLFWRPFEALKNGCLKSEQHVSCPLFRQTAADLVQDRPSFLLGTCFFQAASLSSCFTLLWRSMVISSCQLAPSLLPTTLQPSASFLAWNNCEQCYTTTNAQPKGAWKQLLKGQFSGACPTLLNSPRLEAGQTCDPNFTITRLYYYCTLLLLVSSKN